MKKPASNAAARTARRTVIAKSLIEQQTPRQIAAVLGVSRQTVHAEMNHPETQQLIQSWMAPHHAAIKRMIPRALAAVNKGLKPSNEMRDRLNAVKTLGTVMEWSEGVKRDGDGNRTAPRFNGTLTELLEVYARLTITKT